MSEMLCNVCQEVVCDNDCINKKCRSDIAMTTPPNTPKKAREFWLCEDDEYTYLDGVRVDSNFMVVRGAPHFRKKSIHVIEYSAYETLLKEVDARIKEHNIMVDYYEKRIKETVLIKDSEIDFLKGFVE